jgi:hypothetical protein
MTDRDIERLEHLQHETQRTLAQLLELYRAVHPAEALLHDRLDRLERAHRSCDECTRCGHQCGHECGHRPVDTGGEPLDGGDGDRDGYSRKSIGHSEPLPFEEEHPRWELITKIPHEGEHFEPLAPGPFVGRIVPSPATPEVRDYRSGPSGSGAQEPVTFRRFTDSGISTSWWPPDMSGAKSGDVVIMSGNLWLKLSLDGGQTFSDLAFTDLFAEEKNYGGWGCDQVVQYVPSIDCFVLYVQAFKGKSGANNEKNVVKVALASPADLTTYKGGKPAWRRQWHFSSDTFGLGSTWMDFPDVSFGDKYLYLNTNTFAYDSTTTPPGDTFQGKLFFELPLADLVAGRSLSFYYAFIQEKSFTFGSPTQNIGAENYWAAHVSNSRMRIYSSKGDDADYFWRDRDVSNWPMTADITSAAPDFGDWISADHRIIGSTRVNNQLWFAWSAGSGDGGHGGFSFPQAHIQIAKFDLGNNYSLVEQMQVWNANTAFAYPCLTTNSDNEVGISLAWGGGSDYASHAVGILGDFVVWFGKESALTAQTLLPVLDSSGNPVLNPDGTAKQKAISRWGDFVHVRLAHPDTRFFGAFGYAVIASPETSSNAAEYLYVEFGRERRGQQPPR